MVEAEEEAAEVEGDEKEDRKVEEDPRVEGGQKEEDVNDQRKDQTGLLLMTV